MPLHTTLSDHFGGRYIFLTKPHHRPHPALRAERFFSAAEALRFLHELRAPVGYWRSVYLDTAGTFQLPHDEALLLEDLAEMLRWGTLQVFRVQAVNDPSAPSIGFSDDERTQYSLKPVSYLLLNHPAELKHFADEPEARAFLKQSGLEEAQLKELLEEQHLPPGKNAFHSTAQALVAGSLIVTVSRYTRPPPPSESPEAAEPVSDKPAGLGPPPDQFKEITLDLFDEFDNSLGGAFTSLFDGVEFTLKTDLGDEHKGTIQNGKIQIPKAKMNGGFELKFKDMPAFMEE